MIEIRVKPSSRKHVLDQLNLVIDGEINQQGNELCLSFDNEIGKGSIRTLSFDWGVSLLDYNVEFKEDVKIVYALSKANLIEFVFVSEGTLKYSSDKVPNAYTTLETYQNVIISNLPETTNTYIFPSKLPVKVNVIQILSAKYGGKMNNQISTLPKSLLSIFNGERSNIPFQHFGNFNLKIADVVHAMSESEETGIVKSLTVEGQLNLILALQLLEHKNFENKVMLPDSISNHDLNKIKKVSNYIDANVSTTKTVIMLAKQFGISPKKLQLGFKLLYGSNVNEHLRSKKLALARNLLESSNHSISEIVYLIGYKSRSYFSKIFFEKYDILPVAYREKIRKNRSLKLDR